MVQYSFILGSWNSYTLGLSHWLTFSVIGERGLVIAYPGVRNVVDVSLLQACDVTMLELQALGWMGWLMISSWIIVPNILRISSQSNGGIPITKQYDGMRFRDFEHCSNAALRRGFWGFWSNRHSFLSFPQTLQGSPVLFCGSALQADFMRRTGEWPPDALTRSLAMCLFHWEWIKTIQDLYTPRKIIYHKSKLWLWHCSLLHHWKM